MISIGKPVAGGLRFYSRPTATANPSCPVGEGAKESHYDPTDPRFL
jgi:hypothetical protein